MQRSAEAATPMTLRKMPTIQNFELPEGFEPGIRPDSLQAWKPELDLANLAAQDGDTVIEIYDLIGQDDFFGGVSSRMIAAQLRGAKDVTVNINSPGGSFVEGNAIYNLFVQHPFKVTMNVIGWAASAASIVLMGADVSRISPSGFVMIHNGQAGVEGDRHELREVADMLDKVDDAIAGVYAARTKLGKRKITDFLDAQTTFSAKEAVENGFVDEILEPGAVATNARVKNEAQTVRVDRMVELALQRAFPTLSRSDRLDLKNAYREGKPGAVLHPTRDAGEMGETADAIRQLIASL
jgi:ATP-dependent Clp protease protease subunit